MRIGFVGVGAIAGNYLQSLKALGAPVAAVCDINAEHAAKVANEHEAHSYTDHRKMLAKEALDAVFLAIPPGAHSTQAADAANAGAALFVAKPVALDLETARRNLEVIEKTGVISQAGYMARYNDVTQKARELAGSRRLNLGLGRFHCRMGENHPWWGKRAVSGGQMLEQSTHCFDLLRYFLGEVVEVHAFGHLGGSEDIADFEDSTVCNLRFAGGAVGCVSSTLCSKTSGGFAVEVSGRDLNLKLLLKDSQLSGQVDGTAIEFAGQEAGYFRQVDLFLKAARTKDSALVRSSYRDAARTLAVTLAANRSLRTGHSERVMEV